MSQGGKVCCAASLLLGIALPMAATVTPGHPDAAGKPGGRPPTAPAMRLTSLGKTVAPATQHWFAEQARITIASGGAVFVAPAYSPPNRTIATTCNISGLWQWGFGTEAGTAPMVFSEPAGDDSAATIAGEHGTFTIVPTLHWSWREAHGVLRSDGHTLAIDYGPPECSNTTNRPGCRVNGALSADCDLITVATDGAPGHGTFRRAAPEKSARYYAPDNASDPRTHYGGTYVRDFFYTFSMAPDVMPAVDIANTLGEAPLPSLCVCNYPHAVCVWCGVGFVVCGASANSTYHDPPPPRAPPSRLLLLGSEHGVGVCPRGWDPTQPAEKCLGLLGRRALSCSRRSKVRHALWRHCVAVRRPPGWWIKA
jgi:hypothetical protein